VEGSVSAAALTSAEGEFITANANRTRNYKALQSWPLLRPDTAFAVPPPRSGQKEMGAAPTAPQGQSQATPAGWPLEKGTLTAWR